MSRSQPILRYRRLPRLGARFLLAAMLGLLLSGPDAAMANSGMRDVPKPVARIIGGHDVKIGSRPWQVLLDINRTGLAYTCGGTIIAPRWILTAAHCTNAVVDRPGNIEVIAGTVRLESGEGTVVAVEQVRVHPGYDGSAANHPNDVSLLRLAEPLPFVTVRLMAPEDETRFGGHDTPGLVIGFGATEDGGGASARLLETSVPLKSYEACKKVYGSYLSPSMICAGLDQGGRDTCQGDSGGPLLVKDELGDFVQIGIVSWGAGCAVAGRYGVYTRISSYLDWIASETRLSIATLTGFAADPEMVAGAAPPVIETTAALAATQSYPSAPPAVSAIGLATAPILTTATPRLPPPNLATFDIPERPHGNRALLIGIDDYWDDDFDLTGSVADVERVRRMLLDNGTFTESEILVLTDADATRANIHLAFERWLTGQTRPDDLVMLYFAGHGFHQQDLNGDERDGIDEAIVPYDANRFRARDLIRPAVMRVIIDDEIGMLLRAIADRKVTAVFDSCFSGSVTRNLSSNVPALANARSLDLRLGGSFMPLPRSSMRSNVGAADLIDHRNANLVVWTAVSEREVALIDRSRTPEGGVFTAAFVEGLDGKAADWDHDGRVSHIELLDHVRQRSSDYCAANPSSCGIGMTPTLEAASELYVTEAISRAVIDKPALVAATDLLTSTEGGGGRQQPPAQPVASAAAEPVVTITPPLAVSPPVTAPPVTAPPVSTPPVSTPPVPAPRPEPAKVPADTAGETADAEDVVAMVATAPATAAETARPEQAPDKATVPAQRRSDVHLTLHPTSRVTVGERIHLSVEAARDGRLFVIDVRENGEMVQIFPNRLAEIAGQKSSMTAGETIVFPKLEHGYDFTAELPTGRGRLVAILASPRSEIAAVLDRHSDLKAIKDMRTYLAEVAATLRTPSRDGFAMRLPDWAMHAVDYEIVK
ncbi:MAG: trypsin-like serine protease [Minwuia sp.]|nr:trypsin-like serine protease [Minwuia sp.]